MISKALSVYTSDCDSDHGFVGGGGGLMIFSAYLRSANGEAKVMFSVVSVSHSVHGGPGGGVLTHCPHSDWKIWKNGTVLSNQECSPDWKSQG